MQGGDQMSDVKPTPLGKNHSQDGSQWKVFNFIYPNEVSQYAAEFIRNTVCLKR